MYTVFDFSAPIRPNLASTKGDSACPRVEKHDHTLLAIDALQGCAEGSAVVWKCLGRFKCIVSHNVYTRAEVGFGKRKCRTDNGITMLRSVEVDEGRSC